MPVDFQHIYTDNLRTASGGAKPLQGLQYS